MKSLGIRVTIIEPGYYATGYDSAAKQPDAIEAYTEIHARAAQALAAIIGPPSDPSETVDAVLEIVDAETPPLRLLIGGGMLPLLTSVYRDRLEEFAKWHRSANAITN